MFFWVHPTASTSHTIRKLNPAGDPQSVEVHFLVKLNVSTNTEPGFMSVQLSLMQTSWTSKSGGVVWLTALDESSPNRGAGRSYTGGWYLFTIPLAFALVGVDVWANATLPLPDNRTKISSRLKKYLTKFCANVLMERSA
jgi:hypothetical protein